MGIFKNVFVQKKAIDPRLIGVWVSDLEDELTVSNLGNVKMTFSETGNLTYDMISDGKIQRINMIFWTDGDILVSDQPSHPKKEKTAFKFESERKLILEFGGERSVFLRS
jgi:hypothetical protein